MTTYFHIVGGGEADICTVYGAASRATLRARSIRAGSVIIVIPLAARRGPQAALLAQGSLCLGMSELIHGALVGLQELPNRELYILISQHGRRLAY